MFLFILSASALSTILFGLAPALQATRTSLVEALRGEFGARVSSSRLRSMLMVSQISVCVILLVLTGILLRGSGAYQHKDLGYNIHGVVYPLFIGRVDASPRRANLRSGWSPNHGWINGGGLASAALPDRRSDSGDDRAKLATGAGRIQHGVA